MIISYFVIKEKITMKKIIGIIFIVIGIKKITKNIIELFNILIINFINSFFCN